MKKITLLAILMCGLAALPAWAQDDADAAPPPAPDYQPLSADQLDQVLAPIALYPDPLLSEVLEAATFPTQIVLADRYISGGGNPNAADQQPWDPSVQALVHYPTVLQWMDNNLPWTTEVGEAFMYQQQDVMDSIQRLRTDAYNVGNLRSTPQEQVVDDGGDIEILPADDNVIYLPSYQPDEVYYAGGYSITFGTAFPIGIWLGGDFDWHHHNIVCWDLKHPRPHGWWHELPLKRNAEMASHATVWHPANHPGAVAVNRGGDRGWANQAAVENRAIPARGYTSPPVRVEHPTPAPVVRSEPGERVEPAPVIHGGSVAQMHPQGSPVERYGISKPSTSTGEYIGVQSSRETKAFSERGQQSMETVTHSEPARSEPARSEPARSEPERSEPAHSEPAHSEPAPESHSGGGGGGGGGGRR